MKKYLPFIIMILVVAGVLVAVNLVSMNMDKQDLGPSFMFSATDRKGVPYTEAVFSENKITMVNFWEPWCGPCVNEMPDIQKLYSDYKDDGLMVIGVYSNTEMEPRVDQILTSARVKYPIIQNTDSFNKFRSGAVPTTVFFDSSGHVIDMKKDTSKSGQPVVVGSRSYADWEAMIKPYLK